MLEKKLKVGMMCKRTGLGVRQDDLVDKMAKQIDKYELDIFLAAEWIFMHKDKIYTKQEKEDTIGDLCFKTRDTHTLIIPGSIMWFDDDFSYNAAPIISNGKILGEDYKKTDAGSTFHTEERGCKKPYYDARSKEKKKLFEWETYRFGVDICADIGNVKDLINKNEDLLDFYFLISCGLTLSRFDVRPIKYKRYALCCNGAMSNRNKVLQREDDQRKTLSRDIDAKEFKSKTIEPKDIIDDSNIMQRSIKNIFKGIGPDLDYFCLYELAM